LRWWAAGHWEACRACSGLPVPERVRRVAAWCSAARCHAHNLLFLRALEAALLADPLSAGDDKPVAGLRAFGRVYASRAYGPRFVSEGHHHALGFPDIEALLGWWEDDHLAMNHHDLLAVLRMWATPISRPTPASAAIMRRRSRRSPRPRCTCLQHRPVFPRARGRGRGRAHAARDFRVMRSEWGHCAGGLGANLRHDAAVAGARRVAGALRRAAGHVARLPVTLA